MKIVKFPGFSGYMFIVGLLAVFVCVAGCGSNAEMGYVTGRVTLDGKPVPEGLRVTFVPKAPGGSSSTGITKDDGTFEMNFSFSKKGVMVGDCSITFDIRNDSEGKEGKVRNPTKFKIPRKYRDNYGQVIEVKSGKQVINLELTSD